MACTVGSLPHRRPPRPPRGRSTLPIVAGETLSGRQLLEALLIPSANNIAALLAVRVGGGTGAFLARMNRAARELGMSRTTYTDPSGLAASTLSTPSDQLKPARVDLEDPTFAHIVAMPAVSLPVVGRVANLDYLVGHRGYVGVKTGSDEAAGGCLVFARRMTAGGRTFTVLGAVFGQRVGEPVACRHQGDDARERRRQDGRGAHRAGAERAVGS